MLQYPFLWRGLNPHDKMFCTSSYRLTLLVYLLFCCWIVSIDARLLLKLVKVAVLGRSLHVLVLQRHNLVSHQKIVIIAIVVALHP